MCAHHFVVPQAFVWRKLAEIDRQALSVMRLDFAYIQHLSIPGCEAKAHHWPYIGSHRTAAATGRYKQTVQRARLAYAVTWNLHRRTCHSTICSTSCSRQTDRQTRLYPWVGRTPDVRCSVNRPPQSRKTQCNSRQTPCSTCVPSARTIALAASRPLP